MKTSRTGVAQEGWILSGGWTAVLLVRMDLVWDTQKKAVGDPWRHSIVVGPHGELDSQKFCCSIHSSVKIILFSFWECFGAIQSCVFLNDSPNSPICFHFVFDFVFV